MRRYVSWFALLILPALPAEVRPAETSKPARPGLVVRLAPIDELIADAKYLATLGGQKDKAHEVEGFLQTFRDPDGLQGIDTKRPLGFYGSVGQGVADVSGVALVPIANEKTFLSALSEKLNISPDKDEDGIYAVTGKLPVPIYFRFANRYLYAAALSKAALAKDRLLDPARALAQAGDGTVAGAFHFGDVPDAIKNIALQQFDQQFARAREQTVPNEGELQRDVRLKSMEFVGNGARAVIREGGDFTFRVNIDRRAGGISADLGFSGKPGSGLARGIARLGEESSLFGGLVPGDAAMGLLAHLALPADLRKALEPAIDQGLRDALKKEQDPNKREQGEKFLKALEPTLKAGELDGALTFNGPDKDQHYTFVAALKLREGGRLEQAFRDLVAVLPEADRQKIKLDAETVGDVKVHRLEAQRDFDPPTRKILGSNPVYVANRGDALFVAGGPGATGLVRKAIEAAAKESPILRFDLALARLAPLMEKDNPGATKAAREAFGAPGAGNDRVHVTVEGGESLRAHLDIRGAAVRFFGLLDSYKKKGQSDEEGK